MKYKLTSIERVRTTTGKDKADIVLNGTTKATIWGDFPNFSNLTEGMEIEGDLIPAKDPKYSPTLSSKVSTGGSFKPSGGISKLMDKKAEYIEKAQERKAESIAYFNSVNSAIALVQKVRNEFGENLGDAEIKTFISYWRDWFISEYEKWNQKPPF